MTTPVLQVNHISKSFGLIKAVDDLAFSLEPGKIYGFIGENGAGKTTTLKILSTLLLPDEGDVLLLGESILVNPQFAIKNLGFMSDRFISYMNLTVHEVLDFFAHARGLSGIAKQKAVKFVVDICGVGGFLNQQSSQLSRGMEQRVFLAQTLLHNPAILLLDEPANGLDPQARIGFRNILTELTSWGKTILISSHILSDIEEISDQILVMHQGRVNFLDDFHSSSSLKTNSYINMRLKTLSTTDSAVQILAKHSAVRDIAIENQPGVITFKFYQVPANLPILLQLLIQHNIQVIEFMQEKPSLESFFLQQSQVSS